MSIPASAKYAIIREMTMRDNNRLNLSWLCETAGVSRSGYYSYLESEDLRQQRSSMNAKNSSRFWKHISSGDTAKAHAAFICG